MAISNSDIIYSSTIYAHTPCTIFLRNQNNRHITRAKADTNIPFIQKCLYLLLNFLRLLGIGPVWCPVQKEAPGIRSIWCSIPRNGGKPAGISAGNTSSKSCKTLDIIGEIGL